MKTPEKQRAYTASTNVEPGFRDRVTPADMAGTAPILPRISSHGERVGSFWSGDESPVAPSR